MENESALSVEAVKRIAIRETETSIAAKHTILDEHSASFRWLMASMLAINAGGMLKVADFEGLQRTAHLVASISFLAGILAALTVAWLGQKAGREMLEPLAELIAFWTVVSATGEFDEKQHRTLIKKVQLAVKFSKKPRCAGWISVFAFVIGVVAVLVGQPCSNVGVGSEGSPAVYRSEHGAKMNDH